MKGAGGDGAPRRETGPCRPAAALAEKPGSIDLQAAERHAGISEVPRVGRYLVLLLWIQRRLSWRHKDWTSRPTWVEPCNHQPMAGQGVRRNPDGCGATTMLRQMGRHGARRDRIGIAGGGIEPGLSLGETDDLS